jgi:hypothetical protein
MFAEIYTLTFKKFGVKRSVDSTPTIMTVAAESKGFLLTSASTPLFHQRHRHNFEIASRGGGESESYEWFHQATFVHPNIEHLERATRDMQGVDYADGLGGKQPGWDRRIDHSGAGAAYRP